MIMKNEKNKHIKARAYISGMFVVKVKLIVTGKRAAGKETSVYTFRCIQYHLDPYEEFIPSPITTTNPIQKNRSIYQCFNWWKILSLVKVIIYLNFLFDDKYYSTFYLRNFFIRLNLLCPENTRVIFLKVYQNRRQFQ